MWLRRRSALLHALAWLAFVCCVQRAGPAPATVSAQAVDDERAALTRAVQRLVDERADAGACQPIAPVRGERRFECRVTECPGACRVVHVITVLGLRRGHYRRVSRERVEVGDTGECGCCMAEF